MNQRTNYPSYPVSFCLLGSIKLLHLKENNLKFQMHVERREGQGNDGQACLGVHWVCRVGAWGIGEGTKAGEVIEGKTAAQLANRLKS